MAKPRVMILRAAGVNCEHETQYAWELAGADATIVHVNELRQRPGMLDDVQILTLPGGFSYGDDIAAGRVLGTELEVFLGDALRRFVDRGGLVLGICNGFQVLCRTGLLPAGPGANLPPATVTRNTSGKYEDRWVHLRRAAGHCPFLTHAAEYVMPVAHGEGRVMTRTTADLQRLQAAGCVALEYCAREGGPVTYPDNPNGSMGNIAGLCDPTGRVLGLMPHPERFVDPTHHPEWTSRDIPHPDGRRIFESATDHVRRAG